MENREGYCNFEKGLRMIDDWFKGWLNNGSAKLNCELKLKYKITAKGFITDIEEFKQRISVKTLKFKS